MNNDTVDKIMEIVHCRSTLVHPDDCGDCNCRSKISAVLAEPQVIVKDGVEWKPSSFCLISEDEDVSVFRSESGWDWVVGDEGGNCDNAIPALAAATAAIKGEGE